MTLRINARAATADHPLDAYWTPPQLYGGEPMGMSEEERTIEELRERLRKTQLGSILAVVHGFGFRPLHPMVRPPKCKVGLHMRKTGHLLRNKEVCRSRSRRPRETGVPIRALGKIAWLGLRLFLGRSRTGAG